MVLPEMVTSSVELRLLSLKTNKMRFLSDILSEKAWVIKKLKKASAWCAAGFFVTILSLLLSTHLGFSVITLGTIGWGGWYIYKSLKRLKELKKEEELYRRPSKTTAKSSSKTECFETSKKVVLRSKTFKH